jgi:PST family polysaccharide transporter
LKHIKNILCKELFKVSSLNSISLLIKIAVGFISSKVIAVFIGPSGMALVGNFRNFITSIENFGMLGFQNGIIKYVAEYENDEIRLKKLLSTSVISILAATLLLSGFLLFFSTYLNDEIFGANFHYKSIFSAFAMSLPWYMASLFLVSVLNGFGAFRKVIRINIYGNLLGLILSLLLIYYYHTFGALLSVILAPSLLFFITLFHVNSTVAFSKLISLNTYDFSIIKDLSEYSLMALVSSVFGPLVYLSIRNNVIETLGIEKAGYWEAMFRISSYYMLFLATILTVYFLPKLSKACDNKETKSIFRSYFKGIFPFFAIGLFILYCTKDFIIPIIFTKAFVPVSDLFFWQIISDLLKALSLILGYQFFAKKLTKAFIVFELFSLFVLWLSSNYFITVFDIQGIVIAHAVTYAIYLITLLVYFRKIIF